MDDQSPRKRCTSCGQDKAATARDYRVVGVRADGDALLRANCRQCEKRYESTARPATTVVGPPESTVAAERAEAAANVRAPKKKGKKSYKYPKMEVFPGVFWALQGKCRLCGERCLDGDAHYTCATGRPRIFLRKPERASCWPASSP